MYFLTSIHVPFPGYGSCLGGLPSNWIFFFFLQLSRHLMLVRKFVFLPRHWQEDSGSNLGVKGEEDKC